MCFWTDDEEHKPVKVCIKCDRTSGVLNPTRSGFGYIHEECQKFENKPYENADKFIKMLHHYRTLK